MIRQNNYSIGFLLLLILLATTAFRGFAVERIYNKDPAAVLANDSARYLQPVNGRNRGNLCTLIPSERIDELPQVAPLYSWVLCGLDNLTEDVIFSALMLQIFLGACTILLVFLTTKLILGKNDVALFSAALFALDPLQNYYSAMILSETLFTFLVTLSTLIGVKLALTNGRNKTLFWSVAFGLALGTTVLARQVTYYIVFPVVLGFIFYSFFAKHSSRQSFTSVLLISASFAFVVGTWQIRNGIATGTYAFSNNAPTVILEWKAAGLKAHQENISREDAIDILEKDFPIYPYLSKKDLMKEQTRVGINYLINNKVDYLTWSAGGIAKMLGGPGSTGARKWIQLITDNNHEVTSTENTKIENNPLHDTIHLAVTSSTILYTILLYILLVGGVLLIRPLNTAQKAALLLTIGIGMYLILISSGHIGAHYSRFRVPAMPLFCIAAAIGFQLIIIHYKNRRF